MKNRVIALLIMASMCISMMACGSSSVGSSSDITTTEKTAEQVTEEAVEEPEDTAEEVEEATPASGDEGDLGDYHIKIQDATFGEDYQGNPMIVVHYDFTNNSDEAKAALFAVSTKAYQDGVELEVAMAMDESVYDAGIAQKDIKPGVTIEDCQIAYTMTSDSPVEFEVTEFISFNDDKLEKTFDVQ